MPSCCCLLPAKRTLASPPSFFAFFHVLPGAGFLPFALCRIAVGGPASAPFSGKSRPGALPWPGLPHSVAVCSCIWQTLKQNKNAVLSWFISSLFVFWYGFPFDVAVCCCKREKNKGCGYWIITHAPSGNTDVPTFYLEENGNHIITVPTLMRKSFLELRESRAVCVC